MSMEKLIVSFQKNEQDKKKRIRKLPRMECGRKTQLCKAHR